MEKKRRYQNRIELFAGDAGPADSADAAMGVPARLWDQRGDPYPPASCCSGFSSLLSALHRLEKQKWIKAEWKISETNSVQSFTN